jgi:hypothetical protein
MGNDSATTKCGLTELIIFIAAIVTGTACSICSKTMMELHAVGMDGEVELFQKPIFQTFGMFIGMTFGLVMHYVVLRFSIPFPGYDHNPATTKETAADGDKKSKQHSTELTSLLPQKSIMNRQQSSMPETPAWMFYFLAIPSIFDLAATALCMLGRE